jgi:hypothetical protein
MPVLAGSRSSRQVLQLPAAVQPFGMGVAALHLPPTLSAWSGEAPPPLDRCPATRTVSYGVDEYEPPALAGMGGEARRHGADDAKLVVTHHDGSRRDHDEV